MSRWRSALLYLVPVGLGAAWWLRILIDTHSFAPRGSEIVGPSRSGPFQSVGFIEYLFDRLPVFVERFPGVYGWLSISVPSWSKIAFNVAVLGVAVGWLACRRWRRPRLSELRFIVLALVPVALLLASAFNAYSTYRRNGEVRGMAPRYVYASTPRAGRRPRRGAGGDRRSSPAEQDRSRRRSCCHRGRRRHGRLVHRRHARSVCDDLLDGDVRSGRRGRTHRASRELARSSSRWPGRRASWRPRCSSASFGTVRPNMLAAAHC